MKKYLLIALAALAGMTSCKDPDPEYDPMWAGINIYSMAYGQNEMTMIPFDVAFKLNVLVTEARNQSKDLDKVIVNHNGIPTGLKGIFFRTAKVSNEGEGIYHIKFSYDAYRRAYVNGIVVVETGGVLLDEMVPGDKWTMRFEPNTASDFKLHSSNTSYIMRGDVVYQLSRGEGTRQWDMTFSDSYIELYAGAGSQWSGSFSVEQTGSTDFLYESCKASSFRYYGVASGTTLYRGKMELEIYPNKPFTFVNCKSSSGGSRLIGKTGVARAAFLPEQAIEESTYPSREVTFEYVTSDSCKETIEYSYHGKTKRL